jgi:hypothetical protein
LDVGTETEGYGFENWNQPHLKNEKKTNIEMEPPNFKNEIKTESHF